MTRRIKWMKSGSLLVLIIVMSACSSTKKTGDDELALAEPGLTTETDAVPQSTVEPVEPALPVDPSLNETPEHPTQTMNPDATHPDTAHHDTMSDHHEMSFHSDSPSSMGVRTETYEVKKGDTLMKIAFETYGDVFKWKAIYDLNRDKISEPSKLRAGVSLKMPEAEGTAPSLGNGEKYLIKPGDTLGSISKEVYGVPKKWRKIFENNRGLIHDPNKIFAGFNIYYVMTPEDITERDSYLAKAGNQTTSNPQHQSDQVQSNQVQSMGTQTIQPMATDVSKQPMAQEPSKAVSNQPANGNNGSVADSIPDLSVPTHWNRDSNR